MHKILYDKFKTQLAKLIQNSNGKPVNIFTLNMLHTQADSQSDEEQYDLTKGLTVVSTGFST